jgi:DNA-binding transcriptional MerR regulator
VSLSREAVDYSVASWRQIAPAVWKPPRLGYSPQINSVMSRTDTLLKVGSVAKAAGAGVQTLHYYERLGLLQKPARSAANYRLYSPDAIRRVRFIKKAQAIGVTLEETKQVLHMKDHGRAPCRKVVELGEKHLQELDARLTRLRAFRRALAQALNEWRRENVSERQCAGEFCDLIERLP